MNLYLISVLQCVDADNNAIWYDIDGEAVVCL